MRVRARTRELIERRMRDAHEPVGLVGLNERFPNPEDAAEVQRLVDDTAVRTAAGVYVLLAGRFLVTVVLTLIGGILMGNGIYPPEHWDTVAVGAGLTLLGVVWPPIRRATWERNVETARDNILVIGISTVIALILLWVD